MKSLMLVAVMLAVAAAAPQSEVEIVKQEQEHDTESQSYKFSFEAENGIRVEESGELKQIGEGSGTVSRGSYSYPGDGVTYSVRWTADENGFLAEGDHLPTPPPLPAHVVRLLDDLRAAGLL